MPPAQRVQAAATSRAATDGVLAMGSVLGGGSGSGGEEDDRPKANLADHSAVKAVLDMAAAQAFTGELKYEEDFTHSNLKLGLGFVACLVGILPYAYRVPFPENRELLKWCVLLYFFFSSVVQLVSMVFFRDILLVTRPKKTGGNAFYLRVASRLPRYQVGYTLTVKAVVDKRVQLVAKTLDVQDYFDEDGYLVEGAFEKQMRELNKDVLSVIQKKDN